ncbi:MAG: tubulin-like doman-containing protein, partial [Muribaculaceae bacterium]|nr:tubulin-like doman-containing protein [Muribaculaceae bacterium]
PLSFGAGAFRIKSRIAFAHSLADFQSKLQSAISSLNDVKTIGGEDCVIYYWLVSSSLGGTGSGIFNDVLYHINQLHHQIVGTGDPQLVYTLYMPKVFIDANSTEEKYSLNAYGVFSELEAFKKMSYDEKQNTVMHRLAFNNDYNLVDSQKRYCPFYYIIPVDIQTDKGTSLGSTATMIQNTAEMLYHLHNGQAGATFRSDIDNYMNDIMEKNHEEFLVPMGYVSLQKPIEQYNKYMRARFKRDLLRSWLICSDKKQAHVSKEDVDRIALRLFKELNHLEPHTIANKLVTQTATDIREKVENIDTESKVLDDQYKFDSISNDIDILKSTLNREAKDDRKSATKKIIVDQIWREAEQLIRDHGLAYAHAAIMEVRNKLNKEIQPKVSSDSEAKENEIKEASTDAETIDWKEKIGLKNNADDIREYKNKLSEYVEDVIKTEVDKWAKEIKRDFVMDEHNDELSKLARYIQGLFNKAQE